MYGHGHILLTVGYHYMLLSYCLRSSSQPAASSAKSNACAAVDTDRTASITAMILFFICSLFIIQFQCGND